MKSLEGNLYEADGINPKQQLQIELEQNKIEEIILQSIDDQDTLFSQGFFPSGYKDDSNDLYAKDIIDMCSSHDMDDVSYMIPRSKIEKLQKKASLDVPIHFLPRREPCAETRNILENRPFICTYKGCEKAFKRFEHLKRHYRIHTGEKPYRCTVYGCNKTFSRSDNLMQHSKIHHEKNQAPK